MANSSGPMLIAADNSGIKEIMSGIAMCGAPSIKHIHVRGRNS